VVEPDVITDDTTVPQDVTEQDTQQPGTGTSGGGSCSTHTSAGSTVAWMLALMMVLGLAWMRRFSLGR
jgi:MYXO-CTERM domain-containing protein